VSQPRDRVYAGDEAPAGDFVFDQRVVAVFADMIARSVPGWGELLGLLGLLAARFARPGTRIFDLGCSLGAGSASILARLPANGPAVIAIDRAPAMLTELRRRLPAEIAAGRLLPVCADVRDLRIRGARVRSACTGCTSMPSGAPSARGPASPRPPRRLPAVWCSTSVLAMATTACARSGPAPHWASVSIRRCAS
jgi:SAM-dependent methyltransferase